MAGPSIPSSLSVSFAPTFGSFGDFASLVGLIAYTYKFVEGCYQADKEKKRMLTYLDDVKKVLHLAEKQVAATFSVASLPPDVADAIRGPLKACSDAIRQFLLKLTTKHPPKTRLVREVNAVLRQAMDPVVWTMFHRKEASRLRRSIQEQIDLVRTVMELHNMKPSSSTATRATQVKPEAFVVEMGRTSSGSPESIGITLNFPIAGLGLLRRKPSPKPFASTSVTPPTSPEAPQEKHSAPLAIHAIQSCLSTPKSSLDLSEWPRLSPIQGEEGQAAIAYCSGTAHAATSGTRTNRPSLSRLIRLQQSGSNTPSPGPIIASLATNKRIA
ncbi:uncharacterized protein PHACADRAFT_211573 [Phanerochaete carnosa HHB-10118-sp]|uniref:Uncharacterized protein n=1 Tax=Phanerochaete carnosa (strain HHB-10118-sp) TaxID=650164 RepID=K5W0C6_PHACS|nr:uncharacterized protein PHACADRAFT_211573 [Phanerochaete carnosa HHB-10118-sp]EKM52299.1 hypothetical protein PHACADRAFT_211573 [Phanerochaete carnosa HHB-10118-sp]